MNQRISLALGLAAVLVSTAAMAANTVKTTMTPAQISAQCATLGTQFDKALPGHATGSKLTAAKAMRVKADKACKAGKAQGVDDLKQALNDIGVKPTM